MQGVNNKVNSSWEEKCKIKLLGESTSIEKCRSLTQYVLYNNFLHSDAGNSIRTKPYSFPFAYHLATMTCLETANSLVGLWGFLSVHEHLHLRF